MKRMIANCNMTLEERWQTIYKFVNILFLLNGAYSFICNKGQEIGIADLITSFKITT